MMAAAEGFRPAPFSSRLSVNSEKPAGHAQRWPRRRLMMGHYIAHFRRPLAPLIWCLLTAFGRFMAGGHYNYTPLRGHCTHIRLAQRQPPAISPLQALRHAHLQSWRDAGFSPMMLIDASPSAVSSSGSGFTLTALLMGMRCRCNIAIAIRHAVQPPAIPLDAGRD